jgi:hypothetical protein
MQHNETASLHVQVDRQLHDAVRAMARSQDRSVSAIIRQALRAHIKRRRPPAPTAVPQTGGRRITLADALAGRERAAAGA